MDIFNACAGSSIFLNQGKTLKQNKNLFLCSFKKDKFSLEDGVTAPKATPQLHHWC